MENIFRASIISPSLNEIDVGKEQRKEFFYFLKRFKIKTYNRNISQRAVFVEKFDRTIRDLLIKLVFEKSTGKRIDVTNTIAKEDNTEEHSRTKKNTNPSIFKEE